MARFTYLDLIKAIEDEQTVNIVGNIDVDFLGKQIVESLYYAFPLIERLILEIYKQIPDADVEQYEQGTSKTILSIINRNNSDIIPEYAKELIYKYYDGGDSLRNHLFHPKEGIVNIRVSFEEINYIIMQLLSILKNLLKENDSYNFKEIEYL